MALSAVDLTRSSPRKVGQLGSNNSEIIDLTFSDSDSDLAPTTKPPRSASKSRIGSGNDSDGQAIDMAENGRESELKGSLPKIRSALLYSTNAHLTSSSKSNAREPDHHLLEASSTSQESLPETDAESPFKEKEKKKLTNTEKRSRGCDAAADEIRKLDEARAEFATAQVTSSERVYQREEEVRPTASAPPPLAKPTPSVPPAPLPHSDNHTVNEDDVYVPFEPSAADLLAASRGISLPSHVCLAGDAELAPGDEMGGEPDVDDGEPSSDVDFDDDRDISVRRYWNESKKPGVTCNTCGEEGHLQRDCTHFTCSLCGAMDDHRVGGCPQAITCFRCGQRGHMSGSCTNAPQRKGSCTMCGSTWHFSDGCPAIWRKYDYVTLEERDAILNGREELKDRLFSQGGEGYVAFNTWCFNCAEDGHLGGNCPSLDTTTWRRGPSIFFASEAKKGPFANAPRHIGDVPRLLLPKLKQLQIADGFGFAPPMNVGSRGKEKARKAHEAEQSTRRQDDGDDWFDRNKRGSSSRGKGRASDDGGRDRFGEGSGGRLDSRNGNKPKAMEIKIKGFATNKNGPNPNFVRGNEQNGDRSDPRREYEIVTETETGTGTGIGCHDKISIIGDMTVMKTRLHHIAVRNSCLDAIEIETDPRILGDAGVGAGVDLRHGTGIRGSLRALVVTCDQE
ncbi:hypothetical protein FRB97_003107 [Tulasnella sp. 331]|nr:hypothetical protein FRB97_003107 [Tulasnella sp. 331]